MRSPIFNPPKIDVSRTSHSAYFGLPEKFLDGNPSEIFVEIDSAPTRAYIYLNFDVNDAKKPCIMFGLSYNTHLFLAKDTAPRRGLRPRRGA